MKITNLLLRNSSSSIVIHIRMITCAIVLPCNLLTALRGVRNPVYTVRTPLVFGPGRVPDSAPRGRLGTAEPVFQTAPPPQKAGVNSGELVQPPLLSLQSAARPRSSIRVSVTPGLRK